MAIGLNKAELVGDDAPLASYSAGRRTLDLPFSGIQPVLTYPGKIIEKEILKSVKSKYINISLGEEDKFSNIGSIIWSDNWFALHELINCGVKFNLIYLDPPYATGLDFSSRSLEHAYNDSLVGASYIEYMRQRLILMRELMTDDGSIYIHIGHQMVSELKIVMDEIFGAKNFRNKITRRKCSSKNFTKNQYPNLNDYLLFYTKGNQYIWNQPREKADKEWIDKEYQKVDERGQYKLVPIHAPGIRRGETGSEWRGMTPPKGKHWQFVPSKLDEFDKNGEIHWSKTGNPRRKVYLTEGKSLPITDYWSSFRDAYHQSTLITGYPTEKNLDMLKMIVAASSNPGDLVLDPFCGSGTALHAAEYLGRRWFGIDQSFSAIKTSAYRLIKGRNKMGDYVNTVKTEDLFDAVNSDSVSSEFSIYVDSEVFYNQAESCLELKSILI